MDKAGLWKHFEKTGDIFSYISYRKATDVAHGDTQRGKGR